MKPWMYILAAAILAASGCHSLEGVTNANPKTGFRSSPFGGVSFENSKDVSVKIGTMKWNPDTKQFELSNVLIMDTASVVRTANVGQKDAQAREIDSIGNAYEKGIRAGGEVFIAGFREAAGLFRGSAIEIDSNLVKGKATLGTPTTAEAVGPPAATRPAKE